ncbi:MAG: ATP-dependent DNA helicase DinG [Halieaceae bacterium]|nr:ATP-dependent DNA helicase DinG [Halieaceae bacterium]
MIDEALQDEIRVAYQTLTEALQLNPRWGQRQMIAEVANALGDPEADSPIAVVEAGTGTGKTVAYLVAALPIARKRGKKVVVASATIALQEQLLFRDLPDVMRNSGLEYEAALAKGRGRYICLLKLDHQLSEQDIDPVIPLYPDEFVAPDRALAGPIFDEMVEALGSGRWDGDFDSWPGSLDAGVKRLVSTEQSQCIGRRCPHVSQCSFFRAREGLENADIVVTNHDLVLSDLRLGGGVILPAPEDCFYIFDEGHQLPSKCLNHFALRFHSGSTLQGLRDSGRWVESSSAGWIKRGLDERIMPTLATLFDDLLERTLQISETLWALFPDEEVERAEYRLPHGRVPAEFAEQAAMLLAQWEKLYREAGRLEAMIENRTNETALMPEEPDESVSDPDLDLINAQGMVARAEQQVAVWKAFAQAPSSDQPGDGWARWCLHRGNLQSVECQASPILPGELLKNALWDRVAGAVVTSATLTALGTFDRFRERSGIPNSARWKQVASPFDPKKAIFSVPVMTTEPSQADAHTEELIALIPELIRDDLGVLLLFTSRRQLEAVLAGITTAISHHRLVQDQLSKSALLMEHRRNIDRGESSAIFGLASFFEGIDLPGDYCRHVVIAKLPFAVPDDPISSAHAELLDAQGRDPFMEINVPDAAQKLIQASGRLQRTEDDEGRITLLDKRLLSRRYGRVMLDTLPAFTFELAGRASR